MDVSWTNRDGGKSNTGITIFDQAMANLREMTLVTAKRITVTYFSAAIIIPFLASSSFLPSFCPSFLPSFNYSTTVTVTKLKT